MWSLYLPTQEPNHEGYRRRGHGFLCHLQNIIKHCQCQMCHLQGAYHAMLVHTDNSNTRTTSHLPWTQHSEEQNSNDCS